MLKKAGIVVAAAAAGLLAVSPLAFAGEAGAHGHDHGHGHGHGDSHHAAAASDPTYDHSPSCDFDADNDNRVGGQGALGYEALFGLAGLATNGAAPVNTQAQAPVLSCNNVSDIGNVTTTTKTVDESDNTDITRSVTDGSFNSLLG